MNKRYKPDNFSWASPYIMVADVEKAAAFYQQAFGFELGEMMHEDGVATHAELRFQGQTLMIGRAGAYGGSHQTPKQSQTECPITLYLYVKSVDSFHQQAVAKGATAISQPEDAFWGDRMAQLEDLDGYRWTFASWLGKDS